MEADVKFAAEVNSIKMQLVQAVNDVAGKYHGESARKVFQHVGDTYNEICALERSIPSLKH